jgi:hypothetical protein
MASQAKSQLDMGQLEILNTRFHNRSSNIISPVEGSYYWDTTAKKIAVFNGTEWLLFPQDLGVYTFVTTNSSFQFNLVAGRLLEKCIVKSSAAMTAFSIGTADGVDDLFSWQPLDANQFILTTIDQYADINPRTIFFNGLVGSVTIKLYTR